jgi:hypothetical protein
MNSKINKIDRYSIYCLEKYREKYDLSGEEVIEIFENNNIFDYLKSAYEFLHTQNVSYMLDDIQQYINHK